MKVLILGASGATGKQVVRQMIKRQVKTRVLIRPHSVLPEDVSSSPLVEVVRGSISDFSHEEMKKVIEGCEAVVSCLGHNFTFKGIFGGPHYFVFDTVKKINETLKTTESSQVKMILMSTSGYTNKSIGEKNTLGERVVLFLVKLLLPPHRDNMKASDYLIYEIGRDSNREWVVVRPDTLVDHDQESPYELTESPVRSPLFDAGKSSRINVAHFMAELLTDDVLWRQWCFSLPLLYNNEA